MNLLITFLITTVIAQAVVVAVGSLVDYYWPSAISLMIFFPLFFLTFWATWKFSVKFTEPKTTDTPAAN